MTFYFDSGEVLIWHRRQHLQGNAGTYLERHNDARLTELHSGHCQFHSTALLNGTSTYMPWMSRSRHLVTMALFLRAPNAVLSLCAPDPVRPRCVPDPARPFCSPEDLGLPLCAPDPVRPLRAGPCSASARRTQFGLCAPDSVRPLRAGPCSASARRTPFGLSARRTLEELMCSDEWSRHNIELWVPTVCNVQSMRVNDYQSALSTFLAPGFRLSHVMLSVLFSLL